MPKTYEVNSPQAKFHSTVYNPTISEYYNGANEIVRIVEEFDGKRYTQTISGTTTHSGSYVANKTVVYSAWVETTI